MTQVYEFTGLFIVLFWVIFRVLNPFVSREITLGVTVVLICVLSVFTSQFVFLWVAILAPFGAVLPAVALQNIIAKCKVYTPPVYPIHEMVLVLILYTAFLSASLGVFTFDPYRYGYSPIFGGITAFVTCGYALWRGYYFVAGAIVLGQIAWVFDVGSSNYFDHITHALLVPVISVTLVKRGLSLTIKPRKATS